jgi:hypothetical protein
VTRLAAAVVGVLIAVAAFSPPKQSGASFNFQTRPKASFTTDSAARYLHLYSESTDPAGLGNYAVKRLATPAALAATGMDETLSVALGNRRAGGAINRTFTIATPATLPAGVTQITADFNVVSTPWNFSDDIATVNTIANGNGNDKNGGGNPTVTLTADQRRQVNVAIPVLPGAGVLYRATIEISITYPGYTGGFLHWSVPLTVYDGLTGGGP